MNPIQIRALQGSIEKWEGIVEGARTDCGAANCELCRRFIAGRKCTFCPVKLSTGLTQCSGTPYDTWREYAQNHHYNCVNGVPTFDEKSYQIAVKELEFLKSLLPKKDKNEPK